MAFIARYPYLLVTESCTSFLSMLIFWGTIICPNAEVRDKADIFFHVLWSRHKNSFNTHAEMDISILTIPKLDGFERD